MATQQTPLKDMLAKLLALRIGASRGITAKRLAQMLVVNERTLRNLITELREDGMAICGTPESGYFVAETAEELQHTCAFLRSRALRSLHLEARLKNIPLAQLLGQMALELTHETNPAKEAA